MSDGKIPSSPEWCSNCVLARGGQDACPFHLPGPDGKPSEYLGPEVYLPSAWVLEVVGKRYNTMTGVCLCFGYDPRHGFWMRDEATGEERNVSEPAISRTCHRVWD